MQLSRRQELIEQIAAAPGPTIAAKLCSVGETLGMDGTAIVLAPDERPTGVAATTGEFGDGLAQLELTLGEGPGHEAISSRAFVLADQLFTGPSERWPVFASQARERGIGAAFAFPLFLGSICVGVFEVCRSSAGKLPAQELIDFSHLASLATTAQAERAMAMWPNKGQADQRPPVGSEYMPVAAIPPQHPVVPESAPGALRLPVVDVGATAESAVVSSS